MRFMNIAWENIFNKLINWTYYGCHHFCKRKNAKITPTYTPVIKALGIRSFTQMKSHILKSFESKLEDMNDQLCYFLFSDVEVKKYFRSLQKMFQVFSQRKSRRYPQMETLRSRQLLKL